MYIYCIAVMDTMAEQNFPPGYKQELQCDMVR